MGETITNLDSYVNGYRVVDSTDTTVTLETGITIEKKHCYFLGSGHKATYYRHEETDSITDEDERKLFEVEAASLRIQRWCGVCFAWKEEVEGRCAVCGNKHMTGRGLPIENVVSNMDDSGYGQLVANMREDANNQEAREAIPENVAALRKFATYIAQGRWGENPRSP